MKKMTNTVHCEGYLYEHELSKKVSGPNSKKPGTEFISGTIKIATDEELTNIVEFHFTYATATTASGKTNTTFGYLSDIIDGKLKTAMEVGKEGATKLRIDSAIGLNDFYSERNGEWVLASPKRNEGGFIHVITDINNTDRNSFKADMIATKCVRTEADEERGIPERMTLSGVIFDFRGEILPVSFMVYHPGAMNYFEGLEISDKNPYCSEIRGEQISTTVIRKVTEENAWGEDIVKEYPTTRKEYVITSGSKVPYEWDTEEFITGEKLNELVARRETMLAGVKQRAIEWKEQKAQNAAIQNNSTPNINTPTTGAGLNGFNF